MLSFPIDQFSVKGQQAEAQNVILIGWDGVQRNHLLEMLNKSALPNLASFIDQGKNA
jgi:membrane-anchored protein YejM (alkaline phosphatase superfamily)